MNLKALESALIDLESAEGRITAECEPLKQRLQDILGDDYLVSAYPSSNPIRPGVDLEVTTKTDSDRTWMHLFCDPVNKQLTKIETCGDWFAAGELTERLRGILFGPEVKEGNPKEHGDLELAIEECEEIANQLIEQYDDSEGNDTPTLDTAYDAGKYYGVRECVTVLRKLRSEEEPDYRFPCFD